MSNIIFIQARMSSSRLPGKVLLPLAGETILGVVHKRLMLCKNITDSRVLTSVDSSDDQIVSYCEEKGIRFMRGPLQDVAGRFLKASRELKVDAFVRICADSPFIDPALVDQAVGIFNTTDTVDMVTNGFPSSFPHGQGVEVVRVSALERAYAQMDSDRDKEHVTTFLLAHPKDFKIVNFSSGFDYGSEDLCVDTSDGFKEAERIVQKMSRSFTSYGWQEILKLKKSEE